MARRIDDIALSAAQRGKIRRVACAASEAPADEAGELNVVPFLDIVMNVLMFVLATVAITVTATIETSAARRGPRPPSEPSLGLTVLVVPDGFTIKAKGGNVAAGCLAPGAGLAVPKRDRGYDYDALRACASRLKASSPTFADERDVTISANPEIPYEVVVATMDAVRRTEAGEELFPEAKLGVAR